MRESTFRAFVMYVLEGLPVARVAEELGLNADSVYGAKRRVLRRVRELKPLMEDIW